MVMMARTARMAETQQRTLALPSRSAYCVRRTSCVACRYLTHEHRSGPPNTLVVTLLAARGLDGKDTWCVTHVAATRLKCARWLTAVAVLRAVTRSCVSSAAARRSKAAPRRTRWTRFGTRRLPCRALTGALGWRVAPDGTGHLTRAVRSRCSNQTVKLTLSDQDFMRSKFMGQACFAPTDFVSPGLVRLCEAAVPCAVDTPPHRRVSHRLYVPSPASG